MKYNAVLSIKDVTTDSPADDPITLQEVKDYMRLEGFTDVEDSTSDELSDFDFDDDLINDLIPAAVELLEESCSLSLKPKTLEVVLTNLRGRIELPRGPIGEITEVLDSEGEAVDLDDIETVGNVWKFVRYPCWSDMVWTYEAGYGGADTPELPKAIKTDLLRLVTFMYLNRGDKERRAFSLQLASKYSRRTWLA